MKNSKAFYNYEILDTYTAGVKLFGTEVKAMRENKCSFNDSYCVIDDGELFLKNFHISDGTDPLRMKKLLLKKREIAKLQVVLKEKGLTIVPTRWFFTDSGLIKFDIGVGKGKKIYDKREAIKKKDAQREIKNLKP